jgi:hypothetical protein
MVVSVLRDASNGYVRIGLSNGSAVFVPADRRLILLVVDPPEADRPAPNPLAPSPDPQSSPGVWTGFTAAEDTAVPVTCPRCGSTGARRWRRKVACESCGLFWVEYPQRQSSADTTTPRYAMRGADDEEME